MVLQADDLLPLHACTAACCRPADSQQRPWRLAGFLDKSEPLPHAPSSELGPHNKAAAATLARPLRTAAPARETYVAARGLGHLCVRDHPNNIKKDIRGCPSRSRRAAGSASGRTGTWSTRSPSTAAHASPATCTCALTARPSSSAGYRDQASAQQLREPVMMTESTIELRSL